MKVNEKQSQKKYDLCVGNPPYQMTTTRAESVTNVFQLFQQTADSCAHSVSLIYPGARWMNRSGTGLKEWSNKQLNDANLRTVTFFPDSSEVFPGVLIWDGLTVVYKADDEEASAKSHTYIGDNEELNETRASTRSSAEQTKSNWTLKRIVQGEITSAHVPLPGLTPISTNPVEAALLTKVWPDGSRKGALRERGFAQQLFRIPSAFAVQNPDKVVLCNEDHSNSPGEGWVRTLLNDREGKGGTPTWFWVQEEHIKSRKDLIDKWKVIVSTKNSTGANGRSPSCEILPPGTAFSCSRVMVANFDTEGEAQNFFTWYSTDFVRFLLTSSGDALTSFASNVPDPKDFTTGGLSGLNFGTVEEVCTQLYGRYGFTEEEREICRKAAAALAPLNRKNG